MQTQATDQMFSSGQALPEQPRAFPGPVLKGCLSTAHKIQRKEVDWVYQIWECISSFSVWYEWKNSCSRNKRLLGLANYDFRFGWHTYLWYDKVKVHGDFKNHYITYAILGIWNVHKSRLYPKTLLWMSTQETFLRNGIV